MFDVVDRKVIQRQARHNDVIARIGRQLLDRQVQDARLLGRGLKMRVAGKSLIQPPDKLGVKLDQIEPVVRAKPSHDLRSHGARTRSDFENALPLGLLADIASQGPRQKPAARQHRAGGVKFLAKLPPEDPLIVPPIAHLSVIAQPRWNSQAGREQRGYSRQHETCICVLQRLLVMAARWPANR